MAIKKKAMKKVTKKATSRPGKRSPTANRGGEELPKRRECGAMRNHERLMATYLVSDLAKLPNLDRLPEEYL